MSTESTRNDKIFVNVGVFCVDSVDVESHSALTQLTWNLTWRHQIHIGQIIRLRNFFDFVLEFADLFKFFNIGQDSVEAESHFSSTESTPSEIPRQLSQRRVRLHVN
jgi:hypothetical protein